ncbi:MAG TPA: tetratricopeptide repeat protein [Thermoanaerobaculia bacterium]|jgi:tetratricopeptide (TPR) repeat protein
MSEWRVTAMLRKMAERFRAWLAGDESETAVIPELANLPDRAWYELVDMASDLIAPETTQRLTRESRALLTTNPGDAVLFGRLATRLADQPKDVTVLAIVSGDAWYAYALALKEVAEFARAKAACEQAEFFYHLDIETVDGIAVSAHQKQLALCALIRGRVMCSMGDRSGLEVMAKACLSLWSQGETVKYVEGRTLYASALVGFGDYAQAMRVFQDTLTVARRDGDESVEAYISNNIGMCYSALGEIKKARQCFANALKLFERRGDLAEVPRVRFNLAVALKSSGRYAEAVSELHKVQAEFLVLGMPVVAAQVLMEIVETKFVSNRQGDIARLCDLVLPTFLAAGLPREAERAMAYLREVSQRLMLREEDITGVRAFLDRLEASPATTFTPPA